MKIIPELNNEMIPEENFNQIFKNCHVFYDIKLPDIK